MLDPRIAESQTVTSFIWRGVAYSRIPCGYETGEFGEFILDEEDATQCQLLEYNESNEITAIPKQLKFLKLDGAIVTTDAMGCQKVIADQIIQQDGDYMLAVKDSQPKLAVAITKLFNDFRDDRSPGLQVRLHETKEKAHGRSEHRMYFQAALHK